jgi:hypothetical protein
MAVPPTIPQTTEIAFVLVPIKKILVNNNINSKISERRKRRSRITDGICGRSNVNAHDEDNTPFVSMEHPTVPMTDDRNHDEIEEALARSKKNDRKLFLPAIKTTAIPPNRRKSLSRDRYSLSTFERKTRSMIARVTRSRLSKKKTKRYYD